MESMRFRHMLRRNMKGLTKTALDLLAVADRAKCHDLAAR